MGSIKNNKQKIIRMGFLVILIMMPSMVTAKTIYMGPSETYKNLQSAFGAMVGGDTLIIRDGTYTGDTNQIRYNLKPPSGSSSAYTTVRAENPGKVKFDGQNARVMFWGYGTFNMSYVTFQGLEYVRANDIHDLTGAAHNNRTAHHIKFLQCGFEDTMQVNYASYVLLEDCYVTGVGRYSFIAYTSDHVIFRRCVARLDNANGYGMPISHFINYTSQGVEFQNCIAIDSDDQFYSNYEGIYGGFYSRKENTIGSTTYYSTDTKIRGSMVLNVKHSRGGSGSPGEALSIGRSNSGYLMEHTVFYNFLNGMIIDNGISSAFAINHSTFGQANYSSTWQMITGGSSSYGDVSNSLFFHLTGSGTAIKNARSSTYNAFHGNTADKSGVGSSSNDINNIDPSTTSSLKYLVRIESGSPLSGTASDGGNRGATILNRIGRDGTMWGETGYNETTGISLWPWPNEDKIKVFFQNYGATSNPSPLRGFTTGNSLDGSQQTLTKYIWEYLGNPIPTEIYSGSSDLIAPKGLKITSN